MNDVNKDILGNTQKVFAIIGVIVALIGALIGWYNDWFSTKSLIYQGSVQDKETREYISGAEITFPGYTDEIFPIRTDEFGSFHFILSKEYPKIIIRIAHQNYGTVEFQRKLTKHILKNSSDIIHLVPKTIQHNKNLQPTIELVPTTDLEKILNKKKSDHRERIEATGESGYKGNSERAWEEAEKDAYNKLLRRLNMTSIAYEIDNEKSAAPLIDGYGYKAKIVIFTYQ